MVTVSEKGVEILRILFSIHRNEGVHCGALLALSERTFAFWEKLEGGGFTTTGSKREGEMKIKCLGLYVPFNCFGHIGTGFSWDNEAKYL